MMRINGVAGFNKMQQWQKMKAGRSSQILRKEVITNSISRLIGFLRPNRWINIRGRELIMTISEL